MPNFLQVAGPLTDTTKKGQPNKIKCREAQEHAFRSLKLSLIAHPVLKLPDLTESFILQTDASEAGLGAVLLQNEQGLKMPVSYASRKLKQSERSSAINLSQSKGSSKSQAYEMGTDIAALQI